MLHWVIIGDDPPKLWGLRGGSSVGTSNPFRNHPPSPRIFLVRAHVPRTCQPSFRYVRSPSLQETLLSAFRCIVQLVLISSLNRHAVFTRLTIGTTVPNFTMANFVAVPKNCSPFQFRRSRINLRLYLFYNRVRHAKSKTKCSSFKALIIARPFYSIGS